MLKKTFTPWIIETLKSYFKVIQFELTSVTSAFVMSASPPPKSSSILIFFADGSSSSL